MRLQGKIIAVTGASRGLGLAICKAFAAEGGTVAMLARPSSHLKRASKDVVNGVAIPCDVANPSDVRTAFTRIGADLGGLDALVNNAAVGNPQPVEEAVDELAQLEVHVNLLGPLYCMREAIPMIRARGGRRHRQCDFGSGEQSLSVFGFICCDEKRARDAVRGCPCGSER